MLLMHVVCCSILLMYMRINVNVCYECICVLMLVNIINVSMYVNVLFM